MKRFVANLRELSERFDPRYVAFKRRIAAFRYPAVRLSDLLSATPEYGAGEAGIERTSVEEPRYIRITDIDENGELLPGLGVTAEIVEPRYFLQNGDLLFARSGATVGKCYLHDTERAACLCFYAGYMIRFRLSEKALPRYIFAFAQTSYYRDWVQAVQRSAGQPNINAQEYGNLPIPLPPREVQMRIAAELDAAYAEKRKADDKAAKLLASIDGIVLDALGIPPLPPPDTSLSARIFTVPARDVVGKTLASAHYLGKLDFGASMFDCHPFYDMVAIDPPESMSNVLPPYHLVPMDAVSAEYGSIERIEEICTGNMSGYSMFRDGDVIFAKISPCMENGKSAVVSTGLPGVLFGSTEFLVFRPKDKRILPEFLHLLLRMSALRNNAAQNLTGTTGHQRITKEYFRHLDIPVPPKLVQEAIVAKVANIREEAKRLKAGALETLSIAQKRIEFEIIGNESSV